MVCFQRTAYNIAWFYCFVKSILKVFEMKVYGFIFHYGEFDEVLHNVESVNSQFEVLIFTGNRSLFIGSLNHVPSKEGTRSIVYFSPFKINKKQLKKLKELWSI